jgi:hypothetical protein
MFSVVIWLFVVRLTVLMTIYLYTTLICCILMDADAWYLL